MLFYIHNSMQKLLKMLHQLVLVWLLLQELHVVKLYLQLKMLKHGLKKVKKLY